MSVSEIPAPVLNSEENAEVNHQISDPDHDRKPSVMEPGHHEEREIHREAKQIKKKTVKELSPSEPGTLTDSWKQITDNHEPIAVDFEWVLPKFKSHILSQYPAPKTVYSLPFYSTNSATHIQWKLMLYPNGDNGTSSGYSSLYLKAENPKNPNQMRSVNISFELSYVVSAADKSKSYSFQHDFEINGSSWGVPKFLDHSLFNHGGNKLIIGCKIRYVEPKDDIYIHYVNSNKSVKSNQQTAALNNMEGFFDNDELSDLTIDVQGRSFKVHKTILAGQSSVFRAQFVQGDRQLSLMHIGDANPSAFHEFLRFIYTGRLDNAISSHGKELLNLSVKYRVDGLTALLCENEAK